MQGVGREISKPQKALGGSVIGNIHAVPKPEAKGSWGQLNPGLLLPGGGGSCLWFGVLGAESSWILGREPQKPTQPPEDAGGRPIAKVLTGLPTAPCLARSPSRPIPQRRRRGPRAKGWGGHRLFIHALGCSVLRAILQTEMGLCTCRASGMITYSPLPVSLHAPSSSVQPDL